MEPGWFRQRRMGVLLAEEAGKDAGLAQLQASSFSLEQRRLSHQGDRHSKVIVVAGTNNELL